MLTSRWPLGSMWSELDRLQNEFRRSGTTSQSRPSNFPAMNVWGDEDRYFVEAELPGWMIDELEIVVKGNEITIRGERAGKSEERNYHRRERKVGNFVRTFTLSDDVDAEGVEAELCNGVLRIQLPKQEALKPRRIKVVHRN